MPLNPEVEITDLAEQCFSFSTLVDTIIEDSEDVLVLGRPITSNLFLLASSFTLTIQDNTRKCFLLRLRTYVAVYIPLSHFLTPYTHMFVCRSHVSTLLGPRKSSI